MTQPLDFTLLIDDDNVTNFLNARILGKHEAFKEVSAVQTGRAALDYLEAVGRNEAQKPNLIFLDINMPGMNGWEFLKAYKEIDKSITYGIKIILLSTSSDPTEVKKSMLDYEVADFICKPLSIPLLDNVFEFHFNTEKAKAL